jgi:hypothetical protein
MLEDEDELMKRINGSLGHSSPFVQTGPRTSSDPRTGLTGPRTISASLDHYPVFVRDVLIGGALKSPNAGLSAEIRVMIRVVIRTALQPLNLKEDPQTKY